MKEITWTPDSNITKLIGKTIVRIEGMNKGSDRIEFKCSDGSNFLMYHQQDCCEDVQVEDVIGDIRNIIGTKVLLTRESTNRPPDGINSPAPEGLDDDMTWTFYTIATVKGYVDIRWYGSSNGYYSEEVTFEQVESKKKDENDGLNEFGF